MKSYTYEQALAIAKEYFYGNELSAKVYLDKYALRNKNDEIMEPSPAMLHDRLAREFARIDSNYGESYEERYKVYRDAVDKFERVVAQGSPMAAVGNPYQVMSASNCVVIESPKDSISGIFKTLTELAQLYKRRCGVGVDISTLRPENAAVNNAAKTTTGAWSFSDLYSEVTKKICQCISEDQQVLTKNGLKKIKDVKAGKDKVWTKKGWILVNNVLDSGVKKVYKLKTKTGLEIKTSKDHIFLTDNLKEKKLADFKIGDTILTIPGSTDRNEKLQKLKASCVTKVTNTNTDITFPEFLDEKLAYFIGYSYGDGCVIRYKNAVCGLELASSHSHKEVEIKLQSVIKQLFNYDAKIKKGDGALNKLCINSVNIGRFLEENSLLKEKSENIKIPDLILKSPASVQFAFISGYFDADGYASGRKRGYITSSISKHWTKTMQSLLMANGICSKVHVEYFEKWKTKYNISVTGTVAQKQFLSLMKESIKVQKNNFVSKRDNYITPWLHGKYPGLNHSSKQFISASAFFKLKEIDKMSQDNLLIKDEVASIEYVGQEHTYDLSLADEHLFWCEGFYVHNSGRRGALMLTLSVHHPDVMKFATMKHDLTQVTQANISIRLTNEFLNAVVNDEEYELRWPVDSKNPVVSKKVKAKEVWQIIIDSATKTAEPGLIFWDNMVNNLPAHFYPGFESVSTNPCSEICLSPYDSCRLISINLTGYVKNAFTKDAFFDLNMFNSDVETAMQMADNLVDIELELINKIKDVADGFNTEQLLSFANHLLPGDAAEYEKFIQNIDFNTEKDLWTRLYNACKKGRRTGLGTHGLADALAQLNIKYDSEEGLKMIDVIYQNLRNSSYKKSIDLAKKRGKFDVFNWDTDQKCEFIQRLPNDIKNDLKTHGRRNISILTQAPTGSVSIVSKVGSFDKYNVSSGIEPVFRNFYLRRKKGNPGDSNFRVDYVDIVGDSWQEFKVYHSNVEAYLQSQNKESLPEFFVTSDQIDWTKRVELQAAEQIYLDHSISSTINLPKGTSSDVVGMIYLEAWKKGLKGITVYVDGSRDGVLITETQSSKSEPGRPSEIKDIMAPKRPKELLCDCHQITYKGKKWTVFIGLFNGRPYELFMGLSEHLPMPTQKKCKIIKPSKGTYNLYVENKNEWVLFIDNIVRTCDENESLWASRMVSMSLRHGVPLEYLVEQLSKDGNIVDINKILARILKKYLREDKIVKEKCPQCNSEDMVYEEKCRRCISCGWSGCS